MNRARRGVVRVWRSARRFVSGNRPLGLIAGVALLTVPTLFTVFPGLTQWTVEARRWVLLSWVLAAVIVVLATVRQGGLIDRIADERRARLRSSARDAGEHILRTLLAYNTGFPATHQVRLFIYDTDQKALIANFDSSGTSTSHPWKPGIGVTGRCWTTEMYQIARGPDCSNDTFDLTAEQQERYRHLEVIAATPVFDDHLRPLAVLTVSSTVDDGVLASLAGQFATRRLAATVGRVLVDILSAPR